MTNDLSWLSDSAPKRAGFIPTKRGRQPGPNPTATWVQQSFDSGDALTKSVPAKLGRSVERAIRRYGQEVAKSTGEKWEISVQVLRKDPTSPDVTSDDVVPLSLLAELSENADDGDVWITVAAKVRERKPANVTPENGAAVTAPADPFQSGNGDEDKPAARGRKSATK